MLGRKINQRQEVFKVKTHCQILSGNEVLYEMRRTIKEMAQVYELMEEDT